MKETLWGWGTASSSSRGRRRGVSSEGTRQDAPGSTQSVEDDSRVVLVTGSLALFAARRSQAAREGWDLAWRAAFSTAIGER